MTTKQKIFSLIILVLMLGTVGYLSFAVKTDSEFKIEIISLEGNIHLSKENYMQYANLSDRKQYSQLTLQIIKDRIEKHPYVERADVRYDGKGKVSVKVNEKVFDSLLMSGEEQYILTETLQVLPFMTETKKIDYPVISNAAVNKIKILSSIKNNKDVVTASKIISGIKLINAELYDGLSNIDMRSGGDVLLSFSFLDYPVIVGRGNEIRKIIYFNSFWAYLKGKDINNYMEYVDLRYSNHVYLGISQENLEAGEKQS